jgi:hypothetical protein
MSDWKDRVAKAVNEGENRYRQNVLGQPPLDGYPVVPKEAPVCGDPSCESCPTADELREFRGSPAAAPPEVPQPDDRTTEEMDAFVRGARDARGPSRAAVPQPDEPLNIASVVEYLRILAEDRGAFDWRNIKAVADLIEAQAAELRTAQELLRKTREAAAEKFDALERLREELRLAREASENYLLAPLEGTVGELSNLYDEAAPSNKRQVFENAVSSLVAECAAHRAELARRSFAAQEVVRLASLVSSFYPPLHAALTEYRRAQENKK